MSRTNEADSPPSSIDRGTWDECTERTRLLQNGGRISDAENSAPLRLRTYRVRWFVLAMFWLHMLVNNWIWISFGSIADLVACYYDVSLFWVNTLSWVFMLVYLLGFVPAIWFLNRYGLKMTGVVAACANALGAWLRFAGSGRWRKSWLFFWSTNATGVFCFFSSGPGYFCFLLAGNTVASFGNLLEWGSGAYLAGIWFPPNERAFATATISSQGEQVG